LFEGDVVAESGDMTLFAEKMTVYYLENGNIERIEAEGNVKLLRGTQVVTSEHAEYETDAGRVVFTGSPKAVDEGNVVTGTKMTYLVAEERFLIEGSKVFIEQKGGEGD